MSGYDLNRFVDILDYCELTCGICQDVLRDPVITNCCSQTFCKLCINTWLSFNSSCPYDRKYINEFGLKEAPRELSNLLSNLRIRCQFVEKGCQEIVVLDRLSYHENVCTFKEKLCSKCFCLILDNHNCVKCLLKSNIKLNEFIKQLENRFSDNIRDEMNIDLDILRELRSEFIRSKTKRKVKQTFIWIFITIFVITFSTLLYIFSSKYG